MLAAQAADPRVSALIGQTLAERYRIEEIIGVGGMGVVFRAHHLQLKRDVAVKVLRPDGYEREESAQRFMREAESAARLDHDNCVRVYDFGVSDNDIHFMVMPILDGAPLKDVFEGLRTSPGRAMRIASQLFAGLDHAHQRNVVHRDLKPDNLFLTRDDDGNDRVTIVDFGIAKIMEADTTGMTQAGMLYGTPAYMSPEQAAGDPLDARSDLFSAGLLLFRLLTGHVPGRAKTALDQLRKRASQEVPPLPLVFPEPVRELIAKLCALTPDERFQSAGEAGEFTDAILRDWDAAGAKHDQLVELPDDDATFEDLPVAEATRVTSIEVQTTPKGPGWLPWAAGVVAVASFGLAFLSLQGGDDAQSAQEGQPAAVVASADDELAEPKARAALDAPLDTARAEADAPAGSGLVTGANPGETPVAPPNTLQKLALVNAYNLESALPYAHRHALMDELGDNPQARPMINQRVNLALDLLQAPQAEHPCTVFTTSLTAIDATRDTFFVDALERAAAPEGQDAKCADATNQLAAVRKHYGIGATTFAGSKVSKKKKKATKATVPVAGTGKSAAATGTQASTRDGKTGQVIEKLGD